MLFGIQVTECDRVGEGHRTPCDSSALRTPSGQGALLGSFMTVPWAVRSILTGQASIREQTGWGEGSFVETQHPLSLLVLLLSTCGAFPRGPPNHRVSLGCATEMGTSSSEIWYFH